MRERERDREREMDIREREKEIVFEEEESNCCQLLRHRFLIIMIIILFYGAVDSLTRGKKKLGGAKCSCCEVNKQHVSKISSAENERTTCSFFHFCAPNQPNELALPWPNGLLVSLKRYRSIQKHSLACWMLA